MSTHMQAAKDMLFGETGMHASNFKMFPGNARDVSSEKVAAELNAAFARMKAGEFTVVAEIGE
jgi:hypothetical protein